MKKKAGTGFDVVEGNEIWAGSHPAEGDHLVPFFDLSMSVGAEFALPSVQMQ